ncbi:hypothetical protein [Undibacterium sp. RuTC16W]|uniref:hypothetical protein n=1 Tax=Undibacterium sp. RuTC16W TaxID=3413048 RepID=UPI003BF1DCA7
MNIQKKRRVSLHHVARMFTAVFFIPPLFCISANAAIYTYVDASSGVTIVSNTPARSAADKMTDARLSQHAIPPVSLRAAGSTVNSAVTNVAANFPRISAEVQKERDVERKDILRKELMSEEQALSTALAQRATEDIVHRHQINIAALKRELGGMR